MYNWDKVEINELIKRFKKFKNKNQDIYDDLEALYELKNILCNKKRAARDTIIFNLAYDNKIYNKIRKYNSILNPAIRKYHTEFSEEIEFSKINCSREDILTFTKDNIQSMSNKWGQMIVPYLTNKKHIDFNKNNNNFVMYIKHLKSFFISLSKNDDISDFIYPTHEYLHIVSILLNDKFATTLESEFLSLLGELITTYEMRKNELIEEAIKCDMDNYYNNINFMDSIYLKKDAIKNDILYYKKINYLKNKFNVPVNDLKNIYSCSIEYDYATVLSYFIALELFEIYKQDKEKCVYICENLIISNDKLNKKLKDNNIKLLSHDEEYVKILKKEYVTLSNQ